MASKTNNEHLLLLFDRPKEPCFIAKGDQKVAFDIPNDLLTDRFKPIQAQITNRFGSLASNTFNVKPVKKPDLSLSMQVNRYESFSNWVPRHSKAAASLIDIFIKVKTIDELTSVAVYVRDRINPYLFNYAYAVALMHRPDTKNLKVPPLMTTFPDKFVDGTIIQKAREEAQLIPEANRLPIVIPRDYTATDLEPEHRLAYWREDIGLNLHHWHWHLVYPNDAPVEIVRKDRRGEIFFYMHQQIQARYNIERFCNQLPRVERITDWRAPLPEGYFPKLDSTVAVRSYAGRTANSRMRDIKRPAEDVVFDIDDLIRWRDRIFGAIHAGEIITQNQQRIPLTDERGIDILGDILEASALSQNMNFYGNLHNMGHLSLGYIHDPDGRYLEQFGVVAEPTTAMRDPAFYRLHEFVDDVFQEYKATLQPYTAPQLNYQGVTVTNVEVAVTNGNKNEFQTFWQDSQVNISRGLDFQPRGPVFVQFTHLQNSPFVYNITVTNSSNRQRRGTCRIYLAPRFDEKGQRWSFREQKRFFIELDRFFVTMQPGQNRISRRSDESSITIPFSSTFRDVDTNRPTGDALAEFNYCGCGWPQHLLLPKGTAEGYPCQLFVMISNYDDDEVRQPDPVGQCNKAYSFCGLKDRKYPDRRPMGYPFDRPPRAGITDLSSFLFPNMKVQDVVIKFTNRTVPGQKFV